MKVWVVMEYSNEHGCVISVCANKEDAEKEAERLQQNPNRSDYGYEAEEYEVRGTP